MGTQGSKGDRGPPGSPAKPHSLFANRCDFSIENASGDVNIQKSLDNYETVNYDVDASSMIGFNENTVKVTNHGAVLANTCCVKIVDENDILIQDVCGNYKFNDFASAGTSGRYKITLLAGFRGDTT